MGTAGRFLFLNAFCCPCLNAEVGFECSMAQLETPISEGAGRVPRGHSVTLSPLWWISSLTHSSTYDTWPKSTGEIRRMFERSRLFVRSILTFGILAPSCIVPYLHTRQCVHTCILNRMCVITSFMFFLNISFLI